MNIRDFLDVRVICETGSLRKAAQVLGVSQPTLSNRIALLESRLRTPLFERTRSQSRPTALALFISQRAANFTVEAQQLAREVRRLAAGQAGLVKLGLSATVARELVPDIAVEVSERHPDISLEMLCEPTDKLAEALLDRELDLLICPPLEIQRDVIVSELLIETDIVVVARPDHPLCTNPPATAAELFEYPIALPIAERHYLEDLRTEHGVDIDTLPGRMLCSDPGMLVRIVRRSPRLFTAAPRFYLAPELEAGTLRIVDMPVPFGHSLYMHWYRDAFPLPAVREVMQVARDVFARSRGAVPG
jgi:LysR family transcriptional regulator of gallate degradation